MKLTTHLHLVPRSGKRGAVPALSQYVSMAWCLIKQRIVFVAWYLFKYKDNFTLLWFTAEIRYVLREVIYHMAKIVEKLVYCLPGIKCALKISMRYSEIYLDVY
jgi:hypothetical protein